MHTLEEEEGAVVKVAEMVETVVEDRLAAGEREAGESEVAGTETATVVGSTVME